MKRGQVQMLETVAVLFIFFIIVVIGVVFYGKVAQSNLAYKIEEKNQLDGIKVAQRASSLPELQCAEQNIVKSDNCVDMLKLEEAASLISAPQNELFYFDTFGFSSITIEQIYPVSETWQLYDRPRDSYTSKTTTFIPITIFDPLSGTQGTNAFGIMEVSLYR